MKLIPGQVYELLDGCQSEGRFLHVGKYYDEFGKLHVAAIFEVLDSIPARRFCAAKPNVGFYGNELKIKLHPHFVGPSPENMRYDTNTPNEARVDRNEKWSKI